MVNAIRKERRDHDELLRIDHATHLRMEREIVSVALVWSRSGEAIRGAKVLRVAGDGQPERAGPALTCSS